jgi:hypothetical protein
MANMLSLMHSQGVNIPYGAGPFVTAQSGFSLAQGGPGPARPTGPGRGVPSSGGLGTPYAGHQIVLGGPATTQSLARMGGSAPPTFAPGGSRSTTGQVV